MMEQQVSSCLLFSLFPRQLETEATLEGPAPLDLFSSLRAPLVPQHMAATLCIEEQLHIKEVPPLTLGIRHQVFTFEEPDLFCTVCFLGDPQL